MEENSTYQDDWKKEAPKLAGLKKDLPEGKVPEGYFEGFEERLMARIAEEQKPAATTRRLGWWKPLAAAATVAGIGLTFFFATRGPKVEEVSAEVALVRALDSVSTEEIAQALMDEDVAMEEVTAAIHEETLAQVSMQDVVKDTGTGYLTEDLIAVAELEEASIKVLESSVLTEWEMEESDFDMDNIDLSAFGLEESDLKQNVKGEGAPVNGDSVN